MRRLTISDIIKLDRMPIYIGNIADAIIIASLVRDVYQFNNILELWKNKKTKDAYIRFAKDSVFKPSICFNYRNYRSNPRFRVITAKDLLNIFRDESRSMY